jgi:hypothetical protein
MNTMTAVAGDKRLKDEYARNYEMAIGIAWVVAAAFGCLSLYGWWFFLTVGPAHGPGAEVGLLAGGVAAVSAGVAYWLHRRQRERYKDL